MAWNSRFVVLMAFCSLVISPSSKSNAADLNNKSPLKNDAFRVSDALAKPFVDKSDEQSAKISTVVHLMEEQLGTRIVFDQVALESAANASLDFIASNLGEIDFKLPKGESTRLETILNAICDQTNSAYVFRPDHVLITSPAIRDYLVGKRHNVPRIPSPADADEDPIDRVKETRFDQLYCFKFTKTNLEDAVETLVDRTGKNIILTSSVRDVFRSEFSIKLLNTTAENAAMLIAESVGLKAVLRGKTVLIVSESKFDEMMEKAQAEMKQVPRIVDRWTSKNELLSVDKSQAYRSRNDQKSLAKSSRPQ